jgi:hypothetical protein
MEKKDSRQVGMSDAEEPCFTEVGTDYFQVNTSQFQV